MGFRQRTWWLPQWHSNPDSVTFLPQSILWFSRLPTTSYWPEMNYILILKLVTNPENRFTRSELEVSDSQPWLHIFFTAFHIILKVSWDWEPLSYTKQNHPFFPESLGKGCRPLVKFGFSEKEYELSKRQNLHNHFTFVFSKHCLVILFNPKGFLLQPSHFTNKESKAGVYKVNSLKSSKSLCFNTIELEKFLQKELPYKPFLWNNKHEDSKRELLCCPE